MTKAHILEFQGKTPQIGAGAFIAPTAVIIGDVTIGAGANIWFGAVLRGDMNHIEIGAKTSIQDNTVIHCNEIHPTIVGANVVVGHAVVMEGCTIGEGSLIGMNATVLSGAVLGENTLVAAAALVRENEQFPARSLLAGVPAQVKAQIKEAHLQLMALGVEHYGEVMQHYENGI